MASLFTPGTERLDMRPAPAWTPRTSSCGLRLSGAPPRLTGSMSPSIWPRPRRTRRPEARAASSIVYCSPRAWADVEDCQVASSYPAHHRVGESTVAGEVNDVLAALKVPNAAVDLDALVWQWPSTSAWNNDLMFGDLASLWPN
jgi:hypothetical protein